LFGQRAEESTDMLGSIGALSASLYHQSRGAVDESLCLGRMVRGFRRLPLELAEDGDVWYERARAFSTPVVLVHGAGHNGSAWTVLANRLRSAGFGRLVALDYRVDREPIDALAVDLGRRLRRVLERTGSERAHVIGHSLGGVLLRVWHDALGGAPLTDAAATLGSPHRGVWACGLPWTPSRFRFLGPGSPLFRHLDALPADHSSWTTISAGGDALVHDASLPDAQHVVVDGIGHTGLLYSRAVAGQVCFALLAAEEQRAAAATATAAA